MNSFIILISKSETSKTLVVTGLKCVYCIYRLRDISYGYVYVKYVNGGK